MNSGNSPVRAPAMASTIVNPPQTVPPMRIARQPRVVLGNRRAEMLSKTK